MEKPNRENYYKDLEYFDKSSCKYFDNYLYIHDLEKYIKHLENKVNNVVSDDVMVLFKPNELWRMAQKYNCDDFTQMIEQSKRLNKL